MEMQMVRYLLALGEEQRFKRCKALRRGAEIPAEGVSA
jgi:hypothetical protein